MSDAAIPDAAAAALLREVAAELMDQAEAIASTMIRAYEAEIPVYAAIRGSEELLAGLGVTRRMAAVAEED